MVRQTAGTILIEIIAALLAIVLVAIGVLAWRLSSGPLELSILKPRIEAALTRARGGRGVTAERISLEWLADERRVVITADNLTFFDGQDSASANAARTVITLDAASALGGKIKLLGLDLQDGWVRLSQTPEGWRVAGEPIGTLPTPRTAPALEGFAALDTANEAMGQLLETFQTQASRLSVENVSLDDFELRINLADAGGALTLSGARGRFASGPEGAQLTLSARAPPDSGLPAGLAVNMSAPADFSTLRTEFGFARWSLLDLSEQLGLSLDALSGLPADMALTIDLAAGSGIETISLSAQTGPGTVSVPGLSGLIDSANLNVSYDRTSNRLVIGATDFTSSFASGAFQLDIPDVLSDPEAGSVTTTRSFTLTGAALDIDLTPTFSAIWPLRQLRAEGVIDTEAGKLDLASVTFRHGRGLFGLRGEVLRSEPKGNALPPLRLKLTADMNGEQSLADVLAFWPVDQQPGTRNYVATRVLSGTVTEMQARLDFGPESLVGGGIADEAIDLRFAGRDVSVQFMSDIPPAANGTVTGRLTGNSFKLDFTDAEIGGWRADSGFVHYPKLHPQGEDMIVELEGRGDAGDLLQVVSDSRLQLEAKTGLKPSNLKGLGEMSFRMVRPARPNVTFDDVTMSATGRVSGASFTDLVNGLSLNEAAAQVQLSEAGITISGYGDLGPAPVQFTWANTFGTGDPATLQATGVVNADLLNQFGVPARTYLSGDVPMDISALLEGQSLLSADIRFDLGEAQMAIAELGWSKPAGEPALGDVRFRLAQGAPRAAARFTSAGAAFTGEISLASNGRLVSADISEFFVRDLLNLSGRVRRNERDELVLSMSGDFLDVSGMLENVGGLGNSGQAEGDLGGIIFDASVERLVLRPGFDMRSAKLDLYATADGLQSVSASGTTLGGSAFSAGLDVSSAGTTSLSMTSEDAGFLASVFFGLDIIEGGKLNLTGTVGGPDDPIELLIGLTDTRLTEAPAFTRILSVASLQGLSDTLAGEGVLFTEAEVPLTIDGSRFSITGGRASGPAMGFTINGWVDLVDSTIDMDGVLVPSYGVNSALGGVPIIGDLFVSRRGEGVFSLRYGIEGPLEAARVSVNPLSAITPGVLRRIFENPATTPGDQP